jgi:hypothetical protein
MTDLYGQLFFFHINEKLVHHNGMETKHIYGH